MPVLRSTPSSLLTTSLLLLLLLVVAAGAHPVAQGSLDLDVRPGEIHARVRVSNEQIFVQAAHAPEEAADLPAAWRAHGTYLLAKLELAADGTILPGTVEKMELPADRTARGFTVYEVRYATAAPPHELRLRQSLMNEIAYAPGNPWEATLIVRLTSAGTVLRDGALLTHREPLVLAVSAEGGARQGIFGQYLWHGVHHILEGWDHLLFMAALVLATRKVSELLAVVTAFTVAHTLTLTLSVLDVVRLSSRIVEPMIALSIVVVALQNIFRPAQSHGRTRLAMAFAFGLFHGLGFAGGLLEAMQAGSSVGTSLVAFSLGVELGHQVVVLPIFIGLAVIRAKLVRIEAREVFTRRVVQVGSAMISVAGGVYLFAALRA